MRNLAQERESMVRTQIAARGVSDPAVLEAMRRVPREAFLPAELEEFAYVDSPLPIARGADDLAAVHRRPDDRGARARSRRSRARDRHRLGLCRGGPRPHRARGLHHRAARGARARGDGSTRSPRLLQRLGAARRRHARLARARPLRRHRGRRGRPRGTRGAPRAARPGRPPGDPGRRGPGVAAARARHPGTGRPASPRGARRRALRAADRGPGLGGGGSRRGTAARRGPRAVQPPSPASSARSPSRSSPSTTPTSARCSSASATRSWC